MVLALLALFGLAIVHLPAQEPRAGDSSRAAGAVTNATAPDTSATNAPSQFDYASFKIISDRNIFNPNRGRARSRDDAPPPRTVVTESFSLVGTMSYEKGDLAFFDGSNARFRKALKPNETIAGYKLTSIAGNAVKLEMDTNTVQLAVGAQMKRDDDGPWVMVASTLPTVDASRSASSSASGANSSSGGAEDDVLKRLLQKREEELKK